MEKAKYKSIIQRLLKTETKLNKKISINNELIGMSNICIVKIGSREILFDTKWIMGKFHNHAQYWGYDREMELCNIIIRAYKFFENISDKRNQKELLISAGGKGLFTNESMLSGIKTRVNGVVLEIKDELPIRLIGSCLAEA